MWRVAGNALGNQAVYLCAVAGAGRGRSWPGVLGAAVFVLWQLASAPRRGHTLRLVALAIGCGLLIEGMASASGRIGYAAHPGPAWLAPRWILALWAAFAMTLEVSLAGLQRHPGLAAAIGLLLAPLAYLSAQAGFGAVRFSAPAWQGVLLIGGGWALALPLLCMAARHGLPSTGQGEMR